MLTNRSPKELPEKCVAKYNPEHTEHPHPIDRCDGTRWYFSVQYTIGVLNQWKTQEKLEYETWKIIQKYLGIIFQLTNYFIRVIIVWKPRLTQIQKTWCTL